jgi:hypothetical protein
MSYVAEPYAQFVDDLLTGLTGGRTREPFRMLEEERPFRLSAEGAIAPGTVRVYGQVETSDGARAFRRFSPGTDFTLDAGRIILWRSKDDGAPAADALWPAEGSVFYVNYEEIRPAGAAPVLTDRSTGSVARLLAESVGREYAVLSGQLAQVHRGAFLATATGRDLDNLVSLVGLSRRGRNVAEGAVTFSRRSPAPADISIAAGTRLSTGDAPAVTFETTQSVTLRRGQLSVDARIQALGGDAEGLVPAGSIVAINRPVLGIDAVINAEATKFATSEESDAVLRERARRSLEGAGQATTGALLGALTGLPGLREKDIRFSEDPIEHPGIVNLDIALPELPADQADDYKRRAIGLLEQSRPVGIRIRHNIEAPLPPGPATPGSGQDTPAGGDPVVLGSGSGDQLHMPVDVNVSLQPTRLALTPEEREQLVRAGEQVVEDYIAEAGLGETLIYNRLVARLMAIDSVLDVTLEMFPSTAPGGPRTRNIMPNQAGARPVSGAVDVRVGNALVALDLTATVGFTDAGTIGNAESNAASAAAEIRGDLQQALDNFDGGQIDPASLANLAGGSESYQVAGLHYRAEYVDAGVRINQVDVVLPYTGMEHFWVRRVDVVDENGEVIGSNA